MPGLIGEYERGWRKGHFWHFVPTTGVAIHGVLNAKGKFTNEEDDGSIFLLHHARESDVFALAGVFKDGILQTEGKMRRLSKVWFDRESGYPIMRLGLADETERSGYVFYPSPNLVSAHDRFLAQCAWLSNARYDETEPRAAVKDLASIQAQENKTWVSLMADHKDPECRGFETQYLLPEGENDKKNFL